MDIQPEEFCGHSRMIITHVAVMYLLPNRSVWSICGGYPDGYPNPKHHARCDVAGREKGYQVTRSTNRIAVFGMK